MRRRLGVLGVLGVVASASGAWQAAEPPPKKLEDAPTEPGAPQVVGGERRCRSAATTSVRSTASSPPVPAAVERKMPAGGVPPRDAERCASSASLAEWKRGDIPRLSVSRERAALRGRSTSLSRPGQPRPVHPAKAKNADVGPIAFTVEMRRSKGKALARRLVLPDRDVPEADEGQRRRPATRAARPLAGEREGDKPDREAAGQPPVLPRAGRPARIRPGIDRHVRARQPREARAEKIYAKTPRRVMPPLPRPYQRTEPEPEPERERSLVPRLLRHADPPPRRARRLRGRVPAPGRPSPRQVHRRDVLRQRRPGQRRARPTRLHRRVRGQARVRPGNGNGVPQRDDRLRGADPARRQEARSGRHVRRAPAAPRARRPDRRSDRRARRRHRRAPRCERAALPHRRAGR